MPGMATRGCAVVILTCLFSVAFVSGSFRSGTESFRSTNTMCQRDSHDIFCVANSTKNLSIFVEAVRAAELVTTLDHSNGENFTVFAPSDDAFNSIPTKELLKLLDPANFELLRSVLQYHIVPGENIQGGNLRRNQSLDTLEGVNLFVLTGNNVTHVNNDANITVVNISASNGVIHIIDTVLLPPNIEKLTEIDPDLDTFGYLLSDVDTRLNKTLKLKGPFTVFAPSNSAFYNRFHYMSKNREDWYVEHLDPIMEFHVVAGKAIRMKDMKDGDNHFKTMEGDDITVTKQGDSFQIKYREWLPPAKSTSSIDNNATNGVVHIIDTMLLPPHLFPPPAKLAEGDNNIVELAEADKDLSTLVTALKAGKLVTALEGKGPFTVFAPSNEAFAKIPKADLEKLLDPKNIKTLDAILEYHVVSGAAVHAKDLKPENKFKTLQGEELLVEVRNGHVYVNRESRVTAADNDATNGVVHIIDRVLIPRAPSPPPPPAPTKDIVALAESNKDLSTLVSALTAGKLVTTLQGKGPFTVFAPTNEAFAHLNPAVLKWLLEPEHIKELDAVLTYHVVEGAAVFSKDLKTEQEFKTVEGRGVFVEDHDSHITINRYAHVTSRDNGATNGVVHVIDRVLEFP